MFRLLECRMCMVLSLMMAIILMLPTGCNRGWGVDEPAVLTVMTYNIHHGVGNDGRLDLNRISGVISGADCDVVGLQEVDKNFGKRSDFVDQAKWLAEKLGMYYVYGPAIDNPSDTGRRQYGDAILSKYPIVTSKIHKLSAPSGHEPRVCVEAVIEAGAGEYTVLVTHLDHKSDTVRTRQAKELLDQVPSSLTRTILMGDFNSQSPHPDRDPKSTEPIARTLALFQDCFVLSKAANHETYEGAGRIDYIFVSPDLADRVTSYSMIRDEVTAVASDHFPVLVGISE